MPSYPNADVVPLNNVLIVSDVQQDSYARLRNTLPLAFDEAGAAACLDAAAILFEPPVTPLRMVPMTVDLVVVPVLIAALAFLTTVPELPSLVSLMSLTRRAVRVAGLVAGTFAAAVAAGRRVLAVAAPAVPFDARLESEVAVTVLVALARVALALSTILDSTFEAVAAARVWPAAFIGETGRARYDFIGEVGRSLAVKRVFDEVGERTWLGLARLAVC